MLVFEWGTEKMGIWWVYEETDSKTGGKEITIKFYSPDFDLKKMIMILHHKIMWIDNYFIGYEDLKKFKQ